MLYVVQFFFFVGNGNDAVIYDTDWDSDPYGTPSNAVTFSGGTGQYVSSIVVITSNLGLSEIWITISRAFLW